MKPTRRAVIDVGTNSVKLLVADVAGREVVPVLEEGHQTRLGQGFYDTRRLRPGPIAQTAQAVARFAAKARAQGACSLRVIATSAARDAVNAVELTAAIEAAAGVKPEVISGDQEADWAFEGVTTDPRLASEPLLLLDVGGGSTEFIAGQGQAQHFRQSFNLGTVRLLEKLPPSDPPTRAQLAAGRQWLRDFLSAEVRPRLEPILNRVGDGRSSGVPLLVGTGGTATVLGCMEAQLKTFDRERLETTRLGVDRMHWHVQRLWGLPLEERKETVGLPPNRADIILMGVLIYEAVMDQFHFPELRVTTRGLRFAALMTGA
jgi:exopolyphosphatase/guanosine-5'-triphosphate,3'-diphosphate pyrophosphatase